MTQSSGGAPTRAPDVTPAAAPTTVSTGRAEGHAFDAALQRLARRFVAPWLAHASEASEMAQLGAAFASALLSIARTFSAAARTPVQHAALYRFLADYFDTALGTKTLIIAESTWQALEPPERALLRRLAGTGAPLDAAENEECDERATHEDPARPGPGPLRPGDAA